MAPVFLTLVISYGYLGSKRLLVTHSQLSPLVIRGPRSPGRGCGRGGDPRGGGFRGSVKVRFVLPHTVILDVIVRPDLVIRVQAVVPVDLERKMSFVVMVDIIISLHLIRVELRFVDPVIGTGPVHRTQGGIRRVGHGSERKNILNQKIIKISPYVKILYFEFLCYCIFDNLQVIGFFFNMHKMNSVLMLKLILLHVLLLTCKRRSFSLVY